MTLAVSQDRILKVLSESGLAQVLPEGETAAGEGFLDLMEELVGGGGKKDDAPQGEAQGDEGKPSSLTALATLDVALASASIAGAMQVNAQITNAGASNETAAASAVKDLAQLLIKSASDAQGMAQSPADVDGADMSEVGQTLQAWGQGPSAGAAMTTGAQEKRPMQLAVFDVATHFAPVNMVTDDVVASERTAAPTDGVTRPVGATTVTVAALSGAPQSGNGQSSGEFADKDRHEPSMDGQIQQEARVDGGGNIDGLSETVQPPSQHASPARQIASEVVRELPMAKHAMELAQDSKAPLSKLQVLKIQLQPEHLGSVNVRIQLRADAIELHIDTSRAETAELLKRDRETLSMIMRAAGYSADDAQIKVTHADPSMSLSMVTAADSSGSTNSQNSQNNGQSFSQSGSNTSHDRSASSQERDDGQRRAGQEQGRGQPDDSQKRPGNNNTSSSGVYL